jgi:bisphosphoglycerate-independent phosphoglycerate mutase (AlkP superfamily)
MATPVMFFNYRADRGREMTQAILDPKLSSPFRGRRRRRTCTTSP